MEIGNTLASLNWWTIVPTYTALFLSIYNFFKGQTSVKIFTSENSNKVRIANYSPHAVTVSKVGFIEGNGKKSNPFDNVTNQDYLPVRIDARSEASIELSLEQTITQSFQEQQFKVTGIYIQTADGKFFYSIGIVRRSLMAAAPYFNRR